MHLEKLFPIFNSAKTFSTKFHLFQKKIRIYWNMINKNQFAKSEGEVTFLNHNSAVYTYI